MLARMSSGTIDPVGGWSTGFGHGSGGNPVRGGGGGWQMDENNLLEHARQVAANSGCELSREYAEAFLEALRTRNRYEDRLHSEPEAIAATEKIVIATMNASGRETVLSANVFRQTLTSFCPFWPFCR